MIYIAHTRRSLYAARVSRSAIGGSAAAMALTSSALRIAGHHSYALGGMLRSEPMRFVGSSFFFNSASRA